MANESSVNVDCELRFGHCEGHTECCFDWDAKHVLTCGVDCEVRLWPVVDTDDDDVQSFTVSDQSYAIVCNSTNFFIACDSNCVKSYSITDGENEFTTCRFTANATHIDISADGKHLVASAADFTLRYVNLENSNQKLFEGHDAPILSVSIDPKLKYVASASCDSSVRVWNIETQKCVQFWTECYPKSNDFGNSVTLARLHWQPIHGQLIAIPKPNQIDVYHRDSWDLLKTYKDSKLTNISIAAFSFDGNYICAATTDGTIMIWDTNSTNDAFISVFYHYKSSKITCLKWNHKLSSQLCFCDINGQFGILNIKSQLSVQKPNNEVTQKELEDIFADLSDDDFDKLSVDNLSVSNAANTKFELPKIEFNANGIKKNGSKTSDIIATEKNSENMDEDNEDCQFDIGAIKSQYEPQIFGVDAERDNDSNAEEQNIASHLIPEIKERLEELENAREKPPLRQKPFQSGSTPLHLTQRFMVWNSVGIVHSYTNDDGESSIDVEFHDVTFHHSIHLPNVQKYSIADLSTDAFILANNQSDSNSKLFCMLFNTWDATKEWQIEMPKSERIQALTAGSGFIAVATDKRFIRILTTGGIQTHMFSISGPVLCLASHEQNLMILHHTASGFPEEQSLSMIILNIDHKRSSVRHLLPNPTAVALSPKSQVLWAGFTDEGTACVVDYDGIVRVMKRSLGNCWIPIASTSEHAKGKSDHYFIVGLSEIQSQIRCIFCKGSRYPAVLPRPTITLLPLQIPLCELFTGKAKHEEEYIRNKMLISLLKNLSKDGFDVDSSLEDCNRNIVNSLIKLFALALGADRESLALEISYLMPNQIAVEGAIKYAERQRHRSLAQKLSEVSQQKFEEELNEASDQEYEEVEESLSRIRTVVHTNNSDDIQLKPKSLKKGVNDIVEDSNSNHKVSDCESDDEVNTLSINKYKNRNDEQNVEDNDSNDTLKPKSIKKTSSNAINPFKVANGFQNKKNIKRKKEYNESENSSDEEVDKGFECYFEEKSDEIRGDHSDIEDDSDLINIAKKQYQILDENVKKLWNKRANEKLKKKNLKRDTNERKKKFKNENNESSSLMKFLKKN